MPSIPRDPALDSTLAVMREGYEFIWNRCRRFGSDLFLARVMGKPTVCIHGREAAELFYDQARFERAGALPRRVVTSLFGKHAVHTLDDRAHRWRKAAFLELMSPASLDALIAETARQWQAAVLRWPAQGTVVVFDEAQRVLAAAACAWAGVPLAASEVPARASDLAAMVDAFGGVGPRLWRGKLARGRTERWITGLVEGVRRGALGGDPRSALHVMARLRGDDGELLDPRTAAVEVINVIRPTVAIAWYVAFAALALHEHPAAAERLAREPVGAGDYTDWFMHEVRRYYPFAPYLGAKVRSPFTWRDHVFEPGTLVLLDVYGTLHDPRLWDAPDEFRPERFAHGPGDAFALIPQGGGDRATGHRCPGEWITMHEVALALHVLTRWVSYGIVSNQDLGVDLRRMPARPHSGVAICSVSVLPALDAAPPLRPSRTAADEVAASAGSAAFDVSSAGPREPPAAPPPSR
ncbi:MAG TPA: cytochrome P450 [Kofleriaceae bacterium]